jgi:hypothetical protein
VTTELVLPGRYNGPARSANGGFTCGSLAHLVPHAAGSAVEVSLRRPPPLDTPMTVEDDHRLTVADDVVAEARVVDLELDPVDAVPPDVAAEAMGRYPGASSHPFPTCFACGPDRAAGDGLRIFPGPVGDDRGHVASVWVPQPSHASGAAVDGLPTCGAAITWAALDCVGGWAGDLTERLMVLGRMTARIDTLPVIGEEHVVVGAKRGQDGRKTFTASTLHDADGRVVASAQHVWIAVDPALFGGHRPSDRHSPSD